jgi:hypothetical protein
MVYLAQRRLEMDDDKIGRAIDEVRAHGMLVARLAEFVLALDAARRPCAWPEVAAVEGRQ